MIVSAFGAFFQSGISQRRIEEPVIERIEHEARLVALVVRANFGEPGIHCFTTQDLSQQVGWMRHLAGYLERGELGPNDLIPR